MRLQVVLLTVASIAALASLQPVHSTFVFASYTNWARQCLGGPSDGVCGPSAAQFLDFTYSALTGAPVTVSTEQLTSACQQCAPALDAALATAVPSSDPAACPFLPEKDSLSLASTALRRFVCWGTPSAATTSPGGDGGSNSTGTGAGACVTMMADALAAADLLERVRSFDPTLRFTGSACLPDLAREYLALPGRCEVLLGLPLPGFCEAGWPSALMPLLAAPPSGRCSGANQPISWLQGSACSTDQLRMARCPRSTCDLWCGVVGTAAAADQPALLVALAMWAFAVRREKSLAQLDRLRSHRVSNPGSEMGTQYDSMPLPDNMSSVEGSVSNLPPGAYIGSHAVLSRDSAGSYVTARSGAVSGTSLLSGPGAGGMAKLAYIHPSGHVHNDTGGANYLLADAVTTQGFNPQYAA
eukprot:XP_001690291.1 predicted protein [Chlamydomonas reinhardtii]